MPKYTIHFSVAQMLSGAIRVEAVSREAATNAFYRGDYDDARPSTKLALEDTEDAIIKICDS